MARLYQPKIDVKSVKNLYQGNQLIKRLAVRFEDGGGRVYWWVPQWKDVADLFQSAHNVEVDNEGGDEGLFIRAAFEVIESELERCRLQPDWGATLKEMGRKVDLASSMNPAKPVRWDNNDLH